MSYGVVFELNCLWNCSKATQQPEFRCDMTSNCACYLLHLSSHFLQADEHISSMLKRMEWIRNEVYKLIGRWRFRCLLARWIFKKYLATDFGWKVCLYHTVTSNILELLMLISNLFDNRRKWKLDFWKTVNDVRTPE